MECNKIKTLLSEYLDRTLDSDLNREVKEHLLSCKSCSNEFFLMKSIAGELASLEKIKAPNYLLNRVNQALTAPSLFRKLLDFIPGSGGFKVPMEFVTLATTVVLVFLIFSNIHIGKNENVMIADSNRHKTSINKESSGPVHLDFSPVGRIKSGTKSSENIVTVESSNITNTPVLSQESLLSNLKEMVHLAKGDVFSKEYALDSGDISAINVKIPLNNYNYFIRMAEKMGRFDPPAPPFSHQFPDPVLLRIRLNLSE